MENWDGKTERRKTAFYCDAHTETKETLILLTNNLGHLKEAVVRIDKHMEESNKARTNWWLAIVGVIVTVIIQTFVFAFYLGIYSRQIEVNSGRLDKIEGIIYRNDKSNNDQ